MISNFILFSFFYFLIIFSTLGYGLIFVKIFDKKNIDINYGYIGLIGVFFLIIYSYISHFFLPHDYLHNTALIFLGLVFFVEHLTKIVEKKSFYIFLLVFWVLFLSSLIFKPHDDFSYYHFPYSYYLTQYPMMVGVGQFNHGFRTSSSLFYLNSLFYLPKIQYYMFHMSSILIMGFSNLILLSKILKNIEKPKENFITYLSLLSFVFINIFFYRIAEHGTDRSAQILVLLFFIELFIFINFYRDYRKNINYILIILGLIISLKSFFMLYLISLVPILYLLYKKNFSHIFIETIKSNFFIFFILLFSLILLISFLNTGCLVYPVTFTCFDNFAWSISLKEVNLMNNWYELWSKSGAQPNFKVDNPETYIQHFNWVQGWTKFYFFNKMSDFIFGLSFLILVFYFIFYSKIKKKVIINSNLKYIYFVIIVLLFEWFYNHPSLRYGGYCLIAILIFIPFSLFLEKFKIKKNTIKLKFISLIFITILIFLGRNFLRITNEIEIYNYKPFTETYFRVNKSYFRFDKMFNEYIDNYEICMKKEKNCNKTLNLKVKKYFNTYIFINN